MTASSNSMLLQAAINAFRELVSGQGWSILDEKEIQHGYQFRVRGGADELPVNFYSTGKALIQGKPCALQTAIQDWWQAYNPSVVSTPRASGSSAATAPAVPAATGTARIGTDESGKGDYFGPLVVVAVYVNEESESRLIRLGVRDSKLLTDAQITPMAASIRGWCTYASVVLAPARYNALYEKIRNLNRLLAWGHARALEDVLEKVTCPLAIADQFGDESYLLNALLEKGRQIKLDQHPRAEADVAVAAASILARAEFVRWMADLSRQYGMNLPKGASDPAILETGRAIIRQGGQEALGKVAKLHFKTTKQILA